MPPRAMIFAPTGPGSLGDEAVLEALSTRLAANGYTVDVMTLFAGDSWTYVANVDAEVVFPSGGVAVAGWRPLKSLRNYHRIYVIGADVLDGRYEDRSVKRLLLCAALASLIRCQTTIVGFSYNASPSPTSVRLFRFLPRRVRVLLRDPVSLARFRLITGRDGESSADVAFLLEPAESLGPGRRLLPSGSRSNKPRVAR